jgi:phosphinothricin acetyltransferase
MRRRVDGGQRGHPEVRLKTVPAVSVRVAEVRDAHELLQIYGPIVRETAVSFEVDVPSVEEFARRIGDGVVARPWLIAERDGVPAGYAYAGPFRARQAYQWSAEVSVYVAPDARGGGVGRVLYRALLGVLKAQGYAMAFAGIALPNPASVVLHERLGFQQVGVFHRAGFKFNAWHDVGWWERALTQSLPGAPPSPFSHFQREGVDQLLRELVGAGTTL